MAGIDGVTILTWLSISVRVATPLLFAALGGLIATKAGIFNFALEGLMLAGAFFAFFGSYLTGNIWMGVIFALVAGALTGLLLAFTSVTLGVNQLVVGLGINIFYLGLTGYFYRLLDRHVSTPNFEQLQLPVLSSIPVVGRIFFNHNILVYIALVLVILISWFFYRTTTGLSLRSLGENPEAAETVGINVYLYRYLATVTSGAMAAMGGGFLTLTQVSRFSENMIDGRGWIALAAVIFGNYTPWGVFGACLVFGAAYGLEMQMQVIGIDIPIQIALMIPYILTILAMVGIVGKVRGPAALGKPYLKNKKLNQMIE